MKRPPARHLVEVVLRSTLPVMILEIATETVVALSREAHNLLAQPGEAVEGRPIEEFIHGTTSGLLETVGTGRATGYEVEATFKRGKKPVRIWARAIGDDPPPPYEFALAVMSDLTHRDHDFPRIAEEQLDPIIIVCDQFLMVNRITANAHIDGYATNDLIGRPALPLFHPSDVGNIVGAVAHPAHSEGALQEVKVQPHDGGAPILHQMLILPLHPMPSCCLILTKVGVGTDPSTMLWKVSQAIEAAGVSRDLFSAAQNNPNLRRLSARERDVLQRLLSGQRVPDMATELFISQSTVRNHLSSIFKKFGVGSQAELISLLHRR